MPVLYMASENHLQNHYMPRLKCVRGKEPLYDPNAVDEMARHLLRGGVKRIVFDYELTPFDGDSAKARDVYASIVWRLEDRGLKVGLWGCDPEHPFDRFYQRVNNSGEVHPAFYQYTRDFAKWAADRERRLKQIRVTHAGKKIFVWLSPWMDVEDGGVAVEGYKFVGRDVWHDQLRWCRRQKVDAVVMWTSNYDRGYRPFDEQAEWWQIARAVTQTWEPIPPAAAGK
jgi:hypothetical protein